MTRKNRQILIEAFRILRINAEQGEALARGLVPQDIGVTTHDRYADLTLIQNHVTEMVANTTVLLKSIEGAIGSQVILDRAHFPRAKPVSKGRS